MSSQWLQSWVIGIYNQNGKVEQKSNYGNSLHATSVEWFKSAWKYISKNDQEVLGTLYLGKYHNGFFIVEIYFYWNGLTERNPQTYIYYTKSTPFLECVLENYGYIAMIH